MEKKFKNISLTKTELNTIKGGNGYPPSLPELPGQTAGNAILPELPQLPDAANR